MLEQGHHVRVNNKEEQDKVMELLKDNPKFPDRDEMMARTDYPKWIDVAIHRAEVYIWDEITDIGATKEVLYKDLFKPKYEVGKEYLFSNNKVHFITPKKLVADLGEGVKYRYLFETDDGSYTGRMYIKEVENPIVKELEDLIEKFTKELNEIKDK
jgi:hypothetical protein